ncbi:MAG: hypothetical protein IJW29_02660 [Clostridia bacterium]|nr:hypothetical protein [Clostridia bacterium]
MSRHFLLLITLCVVLFVTGCGGGCGGEAAYFAYRESAFCAEISGVSDGMAFRAEVVWTPRGTSYVRYHAPDALSGLCVEVSAGGAARATLDGLAYAADAETLAGLLRPLTLLTASATEVRTVQKSDGRTRLSLSDGTTLTLSKDGAPLRVSSSRVDFTVERWTQ